MSNARTYGTIHSEQKPFVIQHADSTDYLLGGSLVMKNGKIDKILFEGGYAQATAVNKTTKDKFAFYYYNQDHLGNIRQVIEPYGNNKSYVIQRMNYYPFGAEFCDGGTKSYVQNHKYNGKEFDHMHGLNTYDYGARQYNPVTGRWDRMDPLCEKYYNVSPYNYCVNNPVKNIDIAGLYPRNILIPHNGYYTFSKPAACLLSLVSGVSAKAILNVKVQNRGDAHGTHKFIPAYSSNKGGGAITLGNDKYKSSMTFTENFFEDDRKAYNNNGYGQDINQWFDLASHEVVHLKHIDQMKNTFVYEISFLSDYYENGHDGSEREQEADKGRANYRAFKQYVNKNYGKDALTNLFNSDKNETQQIQTLLQWYSEYQKKKDNK